MPYLTGELWSSGGRPAGPGAPAEDGDRRGVIEAPVPGPVVVEPNEAQQPVGADVGRARGALASAVVGEPGGEQPFRSGRPRPAEPPARCRVGKVYS